ncbi:hypothetical protein BKA70DRAFT_1219731 [Coprinopsis sp. MPI-PUGE-AT-0042]|nr:hypothetical protein BKA70DRAFT_1219731 [Coprinopsis sp. MPI-PUGE-AT-0042]
MAPSSQPPLGTPCALSWPMAVTFSRPPMPQDVLDNEHQNGLAIGFWTWSRRFESTTQPQDPRRWSEVQWPDRRPVNQWHNAVARPSTLVEVQYLYYPGCAFFIHPPPHPSAQPQRGRQLIATFLERSLGQTRRFISPSFVSIGTGSSLPREFWDTSEDKRLPLFTPTTPPSFMIIRQELHLGRTTMQDDCIHSWNTPKTPQETFGTRQSLTAGSSGWGLTVWGGYGQIGPATLLIHADHSTKLHDHPSRTAPATSGPSTGNDEARPGSDHAGRLRILPDHSVDPSGHAWIVAELHNCLGRLETDYTGRVWSNWTSLVSIGQELHSSSPVWFSRRQEEEPSRMTSDIIQRAYNNAWAYYGLSRRWDCRFFGHDATPAPRAESAMLRGTTISGKRVLIQHNRVWFGCVIICERYRHIKMEEEDGSALKRRTDMLQYYACAMLKYHGKTGPSPRVIHEGRFEGRFSADALNTSDKHPKVWYRTVYNCDRYLRGKVLAREIYALTWPDAVPRTTCRTLDVCARTGRRKFPARERTKLFGRQRRSTPVVEAVIPQPSRERRKPYHDEGLTDCSETFHSAPAVLGDSLPECFLIPFPYHLDFKKLWLAGWALSSIAIPYYQLSFSLHTSSRGGKAEMTMGAEFHGKGYEYSAGICGQGSGLLAERGESGSLISDDVQSTHDLVAFGKSFDFGGTENKGRRKYKRHKVSPPVEEGEEARTVWTVRHSRPEASPPAEEGEEARTVWTVRHSMPEASPPAEEGEEARTVWTVRHSMPEASPPAEEGEEARTVRHARWEASPASSPAKKEVILGVDGPSLEARSLTTSRRRMERGRIALRLFLKGEMFISYCSIATVKACVLRAEVYLANHSLLSPLPCLQLGHTVACRKPANRFCHRPCVKKLLAAFEEGQGESAVPTAEPPKSTPATRQSKTTSKVGVQGTSRARPTNVNQANVPVARVRGQYTGIIKNVTRRTKSMLGAVKEHGRRSQNAAKQWFANVDRFTVNVRIEDLLSCGKNTDSGKAEANARIKKMKTAKADAGSMLINDKNGKPLVAVFSHRRRRTSPASKPPQPRRYPGAKGRTLDDFLQDPDSVVYDGLDPSGLLRYHEATQNLHSTVKPKAHERDLRHPHEKLMAYLEDQRNGIDVPRPDEGDKIRVVSDNGQQLFERTGVTHLVHCWAQQGHPNGLLTPSRDMLKSCSGAMSVDQYFEATKTTACEIADRFCVAFPDDYLKYEKAFKAGRWNMLDPGPFLGRALVWKLQVQAHQDGLDEGPAAIFCCGEFDGGELYLPDLNLKLAYHPGDLIIFLSGHLYHAVGEWTPRTGSSTDHVTPGRVGNVFFFPKISFDRLKGKGAGWNAQTPAMLERTVLESGFLHERIMFLVVSTGIHVAIRAGIGLSVDSAMPQNDSLQTRTPDSNSKHTGARHPVFKRPAALDDGFRCISLQLSTNVKLAAGLVLVQISSDRDHHLKSWLIVWKYPSPGIVIPKGNDVCGRLSFPERPAYNYYSDSQVAWYTQYCASLYRNPDTRIIDFMQTVMSESISTLTSGSTHAVPHCPRCGMPTRAHNNILCLQKQLEQLSEMPGFSQFFAALFPSASAGPASVPAASAQPQQAQAASFSSTSQEGRAPSGSVSDTFPKREVEAEASFNPGEDVDDSSEEEYSDQQLRKPLVEPKPLTALTRTRGEYFFGGLFDFILLCLKTIFFVSLSFITILVLIAVLVNNEICTIVPGTGIFCGIIPHIAYNTIE